MVHDPLDLALLLQVPDSYPCQTPVDLQPLDEDRLADETEGGDLLQDTVVGRLVEDDGVLRLVLDLALGPLLLLCGLAAAGGRGCCLSLGLQDGSTSQCPLVSSRSNGSHPCPTTIPTTFASSETSVGHLRPPVHKVSDWQGHSPLS